MSNKEKYVAAFVNGLEIEQDQVTPDLKYQDIENRDSVGHMELIAELEDAFDIVFESTDIINFGSYKQGIEILKNYDIEIEE